MTDDIRRERVRRDEPREMSPPRPGTSSPSLLGSVVTASTTAGHYLKFNPCQVLGAETEGGAGVVKIRTPLPLAYFVGPGTAVAGDLVVVKWAGNRWVCGRKGTGSSPITLPGCPCAVPRTLNMSVVHPEGNFGMFQNATIVYGPVPANLALLSMGANAYLSTAQFQDTTTLDYFRYWFLCTGGYYCISRVYATSIYGSPYVDAIRYRWLAGLPGNTCTPFLLTQGKIFQGGDANTKVTISG